MNPRDIAGNVEEEEEEVMSSKIPSLKEISQWLSKCMPMHTNIIFFLHEIKLGFLPQIVVRQDKKSMRFIGLTKLNNIPNSVQINWKFD